MQTAELTFQPDMFLVGLPQPSTMVDGGGCGLFLQWGVQCFWGNLFGGEMTQLQFDISAAKNKYF